MTVAAATLILCGLIAVGGVYALVRNDWVFRERCKLINVHFTEQIRRIRAGERPLPGEWDDGIPSYDAMLWRYFWIWDVTKMRRD